MKKNLIALLLLYIVQLIGSCSESDNGDFCDCSGSDATFEFTVTGFQIEASLDPDLTDFNEGQSFSLNTPVPKEDLLLTIRLKSDSKEISTVQKKSNQFSFGFQSSYACSCLAPSLIVANPIQSIQVLQRSPEIEEFTDISSVIRVSSFFDPTEGLMSIEEALEKARMYESQRYFVENYDIRNTDLNAIADEAIFQIVITLSTDEVFTQLTPAIKFQ